MELERRRSLRFAVGIVGVLVVLQGNVQSQTEVPLQPLAQHVRRLETALNYLGQPLSPETHRQINEALGMRDERQAVARVEEILEPYVLVVVNINPESRVMVTRGPAEPELVESGTRLFLVKVLNKAAVTAPLVVESPNSGPVYIKSRGEPEPEMELTEEDVKERWADITLYQRAPMPRRLSGLGLEYQILEVYSRDRGQRSAEIGFHVGQGTQDIGFRNDVLVVFNALPSRPIRLEIKDHDGDPTFASFVIRDAQERLYPSPSKRLAPDFPFQPQVYRGDGEEIRLPAGDFTLEYSGGPEYFRSAREFSVDGDGPDELSVQLQRWIDPSKYGWWSGDHHVHAAGCSHYKNPTEGVLPEHMMRQILGEHLAVGAVLTWGPSYYYQKQFFSGADHPDSEPERIMHYDLEVSGFPSSHAGHLVLLGLQEDDYPGAERIEDWPSWNLPVLRWAKAQGAVVGFSHSGFGLVVSTDDTRSPPSTESAPTSTSSTSPTTPSISSRRSTLLPPPSSTSGTTR